MVVTAVEPRRKSFSALYIDGEFAMKLDTETLLANHIRAGVEIDDEDLNFILLKNYQLSLQGQPVSLMWILTMTVH